MAHVNVQKPMNIASKIKRNIWNNPYDNKKEHKHVCVCVFLPHSSKPVGSYLVFNYDRITIVINKNNYEGLRIYHLSKFGISVLLYSYYILIRSCLCILLSKNIYGHNLLLRVTLVFKKRMNRALFLTKSSPVRSECWSMKRDYTKKVDETNLTIFYPAC